MTEKDFDQCPNCGCYGQLGLRCHPKFATCFEGTTDGELEMAMVDCHTQEHNDNFASMAGVNVSYKQKWDHDAREWVEYR